MEGVNDIQQARETAKKVATLSSYIGGTEIKQAFVDEIVNRIHRTEQQQTVAMLLTLVKGIADQTFVDGRNEAAKKICEKIVKSFDGEDYNPFEFMKDDKVRLPLI